MRTGIRDRRSVQLYIQRTRYLVYMSITHKMIYTKAEPADEIDLSSFPVSPFPYEDTRERARNPSDFEEKKERNEERKKRGTPRSVHTSSILLVASSRILFFSFFMFFFLFFFSLSTIKLHRYFLKFSSINHQTNDSSIFLSPFSFFPRHHTSFSLQSSLHSSSSFFFFFLFFPPFFLYVHLASRGVCTPVWSIWFYPSTSIKGSSLLSLQHKKTTRIEGVLPLAFLSSSQPSFRTNDNNVGEIYSSFP